MKKYTFLISLFVFMFVVTSVAYANHSWGKYHWNLSTAQTSSDPLDLVNNLSTGWQTSLITASNDWNASVLKNEVVAGTGNANCDPTLGKVEVCNGAYGNNGWLGIAQIWAYRGKDSHIAQGVVKLNDTYFSSAPYNSSAWRNFVMCQEVGHTFGLDHQDETFSNTNLGTCMDYTNDPDGSIYGQLNNEHPNQHDLDQLASIYAHLNGTSGGKGNGKGKPANVGNVTLSGPVEWGRAVAQDARGRDSQFVRNLDNGVEVITHVLWAE